VKKSIFPVRLFLPALVFLLPAVRALDLASPGGDLVLSFHLEDRGGRKACPVYSLSWKGTPILAPAALGFRLAGGRTLEEGFRVLSVRRGRKDETWTPVWGERNRIRDQYNWMTVLLGRPGPVLEIEFRCFDTAAAFRFRILGKGRITIERELTRFRFYGDHPCWVTRHAQGRYSRLPLSKAGNHIERPLTVEIPGGPVVALGEAACIDYARTKLASLEDEPLTIGAELSGPVGGELPLATPWRVILVAPTAARLLERGTDVFYNLNDPCALEDTSWIRPGKAIREMTLTTRGGKACVDFCVSHGLQFVEFDAGWYGPENSPESDATTVTLDPHRSRGPLDLPEVIRYARSKGIGVILYVNRRALERQLDTILPLYRKWGVSGVKYGFVHVGSMEYTSWLHMAVRKAAENRLMVDIHDEYRPTGYSRTYPNLMTQEGIRGDEERPPAALTLAVLFTRMLCGPADNTVCYFSKRVGGSLPFHAFQLAKAVCIFSPWQFLFWYDRPLGSLGGKTGNLERIVTEVPELEFFRALPTTWDETRVLAGKIGRYAVVARRKGREWFVGCMNAGRARTLEVDLGFLEEGSKYEATIYYDDPSVPSRTHVGVRKVEVDSRAVLKAELLPSRGQAIRIVPK